MSTYFDTLNQALESEGLIEFWPLGVNIEYGQTKRVHAEYRGKQRLISVYRNNAGRYEKPTHYEL